MFKTSKFYQFDYIDQNISKKLYKIILYINIKP